MSESQRHTVDGYFKEVKKKLVCFRRTKKRLLDGVKNEYYEQNAGIDPVKLFGEPDELASTLQDTIDIKEKELAERRRKIFIILGIAVTALVLIALTVDIAEALLKGGNAE